MDENPYRAPQAIPKIRASRFEWAAIPAYAMLFFGVVHLAVAGFALFYILRNVSVFAGTVGIVFGLVGTLLAFRACQAWLRHQWNDANFRSLGVFVVHVAELFILA